MADHELGIPRSVRERAPLEVLGQIEQTLLDAPEVAREEARVEARAESARQVRRSYRWLVLAAVIAAVVVSVATSLIAITMVTREAAARQASEQAALERQGTVDQALTRLQEANDELLARGQAPVGVPVGDDPSEAIAAAVTARVLASLPPSPTAEQVGQAIVGAVSANILGPTRQQIADQVSAYLAAHPPLPGPAPSQADIDAAVARALAANPPPAGPQGERGERGDACLPTDAACVGPRGPGPTDEQVAAVVAAWLAEHPPPVCPDGTHLAAVTYGALGPTGQGCVDDDPDDEPDEEGPP